MESSGDVGLGCLTRRGVLAGCGAGMLGIVVGRPAVPGLASPPRQDATPTARLGSETLRDLLRLAPEGLPPADAVRVPFVTYADIAAQLAALGVAPPAVDDTSGTARWFAALRGFALFGSVDVAATSAWRDAFGWTVYDIDQLIEYVDPGGRVLVLRGRFDQDAIRRAMERSSYRSSAANAATIYSLFPDADGFDSANPASLLMVGALNNVALWDDGTLLGTGSLATLGRALAVADGGEPTLAERGDVATLLASIDEPLANAVLVDGRAYSYDEFVASLGLGDGTPVVPDILATVIAEAEASGEAERIRLPPLSLVLTGMTAGGPVPEPRAIATMPVTTAAREARVHFYLLFDSVREAEVVVPVLERRLDLSFSIILRQPWSAVFERRSVRTVPDQPIVLLDIGGGAVRDDWRSMVFQDDLAFLSW